MNSKNKGKKFIAQHQGLGLPDDEELKNSSNIIWIEEYTREDGAKVEKQTWRRLD